MSKSVWRPGTVLYPVPAVMVSCGTIEKPNIITVAWCGTLCTSPAMTYVSIRPERFSYKIIEESKEFVINLTTEALVHSVDYCGVKSGKDVDKFKECSLTASKSVNVIFIAEVVSVSVDDKYFDETGKFHFERTKPICYSHGEYYGLGKPVGSFGYSVRKKKNKKYKGKEKGVKK